MATRARQTRARSPRSHPTLARWMAGWVLHRGGNALDGSEEDTDAALAPTTPRLLPHLEGSQVELRYAKQRLVYKYALPYALLLQPHERPTRTRDHDGVMDPTPGSAAGRMSHATVWVSGLADGATEEEVRSLLRPLQLPPCSVTIPRCGGSCNLTFDAEAPAAACVAALDRREWKGRLLVAMLSAVARQKLEVHHRVKVLLKRLADGDVGNSGEDGGGNVRDGGGGGGGGRIQKRRARSFHNFSSDKARLRGASTEAHHLQMLLDHCKSSIHEDLRYVDYLDLRPTSLPVTPPAAPPPAASPPASPPPASAPPAPPPPAPPHLPTAGTAAASTLSAADSWAEWARGDWLVVAFSARDFAPQTVRRMAGLLAAVARGDVPAEYIDRCFTEVRLPTPLAPAEAMWLDRIQLAPKAHKAWVEASGMRIDAMECRAAQVAIERAVRDAAAEQLCRFAEEDLSALRAG